MPDTLRFVDSIASVPSVRLDLNDDVTWGFNYEGSDLSPPGLRRAVAGTLLADGGVYPASAYADRVLRLRVDLKATTLDAAATEVQKLARELDRPSNLLMWKPGTTAPVFFRTVRSPVGQITEVPGSGTFRTFDVEVLAEPFAYGLRETLAVATVNNDPAAATNGMFFDVASPSGDVETPLFLSIDQADLGISGGYTSLIAVRRRGTPASMPFILQAESMSMEIDTTVQPNQPVMSGAGNNYIRSTFATNANMTGRAVLTWPTSPSVDARGTYRVYARVRKSIGGDTITMRLQTAIDGQQINNDIVTVPAPATNLYWVDLGQVSFPMGPDPQTDGYSGTPLSVRGVVLRVMAARTGGGMLDIDALLFAPADDRLAIIKWPITSGPVAYVLDSAAPMVYAIDAGPVVRSTELATIAGAPPMISPGVTNRIVFVRSVGTQNGDDKTGAIDITPYYWPRYLYVRPATT